MLATGWRTAVLALVTLCAAAGVSTAQDGGLYVTVTNPVTSEGYTRIKNRIDAARSKPETRPAVIVFDFNPGDKDAATAEFGVCYDLADLIA